MYNCYVKQARLFATGGLEITLDDVKSKGGEIKEVAFANDLTGAGKLLALKSWWDAILKSGLLIGYKANPKKSWLIVKPEFVDAAKEIFENSGINVTSEASEALSKPHSSYAAFIAGERHIYSYMMRTIPNIK